MGREWYGSSRALGTGPWAPAGETHAQRGLLAPASRPRTGYGLRATGYGPKGALALARKVTRDAPFLRQPPPHEQSPAPSLQRV